jgi:hypothetical protein
MQTQTDARHSQMLEALAENRRKFEPRRDDPALPAEMYLAAPRICLSHYMKGLEQLPGNSFLIGRVVEDGQPLILNLNSMNNGRILHIMSDDATRMKDFTDALAFGIGEQFHPFRDPGAKVSFAVITPFAIDWQDQQSWFSGQIPLISTHSEKGPAVKSFLEKMIAEWKSKNKTGFFFIGDLQDLAKIPDSRDLNNYLDHLLNTPDKNVRFVLTSRMVDYAPPPGVIPLIGYGIDYSHDFYVRDGRFKVKLANLWKEFDILRAY